MSHKVLVIDGDPVKKMVSALTESGFEVTTASPESEVLKTMDEVCPDVVIVSDGPSQLDNNQLCSRIRSLFNLPLILLSDKLASEGHQALKAVPDWDYHMYPPIGYAELVARIGVLLWRYGKCELPLRRNKVGRI